MQRRIRPTLLLPLFACALASAQEAEKPKLPDVLRANAERDEMIDLFHKVERRLNEIDRLLYDASAGERKLAATPESGIGELLKSSSQKSQDVVRDIDRILEIASKNGGT